jgi:plastocyanin
MTRSRSGLLALMALLAGSVIAYSCGGSSSTSPTPVGGGGGGGTPANMTITIAGMNGGNSYNPASASVKAGQTVAWHNGDVITHTATGNGFDTGPVPPGGTSSAIMFSTAGTFGYHCSIHPSMTGTLVVTP